MKEKLGVFKCKICSKKFRRLSNLRNHLIIHSDLRPYQCPQCPQAFKRAPELKLHLNYHQGIKPYQCDLCPKRFSQRPHLKAHLRVHTGDKPFQCSKCPKRFTQSSHLRTHESHHTGEKPHQCATCGDRFRLASTLKCHLRRHTGEKPYKCHVCGMRFSQTTPLYHHLQRHRGEAPWVCRVRKNCGVRCLTKQVLIGHEKACRAGGGTRRKLGKRPWQCVFCGDRQYTEEDLNRHLRLHIGERPYFCRFCELAFVDGGARRYHMRIHEGEGDGGGVRGKRWQCDKCHHGFKDKWRFERHLKQNHRDEEEMEEIVKKEEVEGGRWNCEHCGGGFGNKQELKGHLKEVHLVRKRLVEIVEQMEGSRKKKEEKNKEGGRRLWRGRRWMCKECGLGFSGELGVTLHLKVVHEGIVPKKCDGCWKSFPTERRLRQHLKEEHGGKEEAETEIKIEKPVNIKVEIVEEAVCTEKVEETEPAFLKQVFWGWRCQADYLKCGD